MFRINIQLWASWFFAAQALRTVLENLVLFALFQEKKIFIFYGRAGEQNLFLPTMELPSTWNHENFGSGICLIYLSASPDWETALLANRSITQTKVWPNKIALWFLKKCAGSAFRIFKFSLTLESTHRDHKVIIKCALHFP